MKKVLAVLIIVALALTLFAGCGGTGTPKEITKIKIGASVTPHAEILEYANDLLKEKGYELEIIEYTDYVQPNLAVESGELDANYFQHITYMENFNEERKTNLVSAAAIHYEPLGLYPGKVKTIAELKDGAQIAVPNDVTNEARALLLLENQGLIKVKEGAGLKATVKDIVENPKNLKIVEIEAAQLPRSLEDVDMAVINGNYALQAGLSVTTDALAKEEKDSAAAQNYANVIAVKKGNEKDKGIKALTEVMDSDKVKKFIEDTYKGTVVPVN